MATVIAYLLGLAAVLTAARVVEGFEQRSMGRPAHHWVVVPDDRDPAPAAVSDPVGTATPPEPDAAAADEPGGREPAA